MRKPLLVALPATLLLATPLLSACTENTDGGGDSSDPRTVSVTSTDDGCELSSTDAPSGTLTFDVTNEGSKVTEFYLLGSDGLRIVGEIENIGPQLSRQLVVSAPEGSYVTACKPGMKGDGIRGDFTVSKSAEEPSVSADDQQLVDQATKNYQVYVRDQADQLLVATQEFVSDYKAGKDDEARALYPQARMFYERIEPVAESFGDLDPKLDLRETDLEEGQKWTGWHRIEKDLWPESDPSYKTLSTAERATYGDDLLANTRKLDARVQKSTYTVDQIANGARGLLEEVAKSKITGEEENWSHTDLWDFQANVDGARVAFEGVKPIVEQKDPALAKSLTERFAAVQALLDAQKDGDGWTVYTDLSQDEVQQFSNAVNALSEPLSKLTAAVLS
ncbi:iron uptake system protein EfeO [Nocardioides mangrovi]|uniref:EfeM/EfeO family lipoprotein n=1 Tax=Nocardioides mangrovi TaxID=2874580 RepID=A0ABS7U881_9ACTN|nr:iron uptake system protein EfeO [Nocardioides mangrovi]MBZ5737183.1 EfeM/EfeO family lipoprotein [Nocardioides mangrovi]